MSALVITGACAGSPCPSATSPPSSRTLGLGPRLELAPGLPIPTRENLSGAWIPLPNSWIPSPSRRRDPSGRDPIEPGPVQRTVGCAYHHGIEALLISHDGGVVAQWVIEPGASGAERSESHLTFELAEGHFEEQRLTLSGVRREVIEQVGSGRIDATYSLTHYELRLDPATGHLIGTRNGEPFRLAPLALTAPDPSECSDEPPA